MFSCWWLADVSDSGPGSGSPCCFQTLWPGPGRLRLALDLRYATLVIGLLGTTLGLIHSLMGLSSLPPGAPFLSYALLGTGESLNCIGFALTMVGWSSLITTVGGLREVSEA